MTIFNSFYPTFLTLAWKLGKRYLGIACFSFFVLFVLVVAATPAATSGKSGGGRKGQSEDDYR